MLRFSALGLLGLMACDGGGTEKAVDDTDTDTVGGPPTLSGDVQPLFERNCTTVGCHGGPEFQTGLDLSDGMSYAQLVSVSSSQVPAVKRVEAGDPDASYLIHKLEGTFEGGGDLMPPGFVGLAQADIDLVRAWIEAGAADD